VRRASGEGSFTGALEGMFRKAPNMVSLIRAPLCPRGNWNGEGGGEVRVPGTLNEE